jgi:hypothetical protein
VDHDQLRWKHCRSGLYQTLLSQARVLGLIVDRREVGEIGAFDHLTDEELMREAEKKARELGLCVQPLNKAH